jgi:hypothetical protein
MSLVAGSLAWKRQSAVSGTGRQPGGFLIGVARLLSIFTGWSVRNTKPPTWDAIKTKPVIANGMAIN